MKNHFSGMSHNFLKSAYGSQISISLQPDTVDSKTALWGNDMPFLFLRLRFAILGCAQRYSIFQQFKVQRHALREVNYPAEQIHDWSCERREKLMSKPLKIMAISAHPADFCSRSGETLIKHVEAGDSVKVVWLTHGATEESHFLYSQRPDISVDETGLRYIPVKEALESYWRCP
jgi:hypothetical protein